MVAELCDPVVEDVEGALEMEEVEEGDEALGAGEVTEDGVLGINAGTKREEDEETVGVVAIGEDSRRCDCGSCSHR